MISSRDTREDRGWIKPSEHPLPSLLQDQPAEGNAAIIVLVATSEPEYSAVHTTTIVALHHWGVPYRVWDLSEAMLTEAAANDSAAILLAQENLGSSLTDVSARAIVNAMQNGVGLVSIDPAVGRYPSLLQSSLKINDGVGLDVERLSVPNVDHFVTNWREIDEVVQLRGPVKATHIAGVGTALLEAAYGTCVLLCGTSGRGRFSWWGLSPAIWTETVLGHCWGLDDLFWKGIAWAARKPFAMKAMPPLATLRFDDCSGFGGLWWQIGYSASTGLPMPGPLQRIINREFGGTASVVHDFNYAKIANEFGWRPELGLFVEQISEGDWGQLKRMYDAGRVELSAHAFEDGFDEAGRWRSRFIMQRGIEVATENGPQFHYAIESNDPYRCVGEDATPDDAGYRCVPWPDEVLSTHFQRLDEIWRQRAIEPGLTPNLHWRNPASNCLSHLKQRGQTFSMLGARYNHSNCDPESYNWRLLPYGNKGMSMDYMPIPVDANGVQPTDFFNVEAHVAPLANDSFGDNIDYFRSYKPPLPGLLTHNDPELVANAMIRQGKLGLGSLFFAAPMTHEMNLAALTCEEWRDILRVVEKGLAKYSRHNVLYNQISKTARAKCETHLSRAINDAGRLELTLDGVARVGGVARGDVSLTIFTGDGEGCHMHYHNVPAFEGSTTLRI